MPRSACYLVVLAACATAQHGKPVLKLDTGCLAGCRAFAITVYPDGWIDYMGYGNVLLGQHTKQVTPRQLAVLDQVIRTSGFPAVDEARQEACPDDAGTLVSIAYGGQHVSVFDGCDDRIGIILFHRITTVLGLERWLTE